MKRAIALILALVLALAALPGAASAQTVTEFVLAAQTGSTLVISPEYVTAEAGQSIAQALLASGHSFAGLDTGMVTAIDGVSGNYTRSDENGGYDLDAPASTIRYFCFSENPDGSQPGQGLQKLMSAMADYRRKPDDVQAAAKTAYDSALKQFVGIADGSAELLASRLNQAVADYEAILAGETYALSFLDGGEACSVENNPQFVVTVENSYGKQWVDDGDGAMELPKGTYTFCIARNGIRAQGQVTLPGAGTVAVEMPEETWLKTDSFRLSGSYGADSNTENKFTDAEFTLPAWNGWSLETAVEDTFSGAVYAYVDYDETQLATVPELTAQYQTASTGETMVKGLTLCSLTSGAYDVLAAGTQANTVRYCLSAVGEDGYTYSQEYVVTFRRTPTLSGITLLDQDGTEQVASEAFDSTVREYTYKVLDTVKTVELRATPSFAGTSVTVNGQDAQNGITLPVSGDTSVEIVVSSDGGSSTYTLHIRPGQGQNMFFLADSDVEVQVVNRNGVIMPYVAYQESPTQRRYRYTLVPGESYSYIATRQTYYHIADTFALEELSDSTITINFAQMGDWLTSLDFGAKGAANQRGNLPLEDGFNAAQHSYTLRCVDTQGFLYAWVTAEEADVNIRAIYNQIFASKLYHGVEKQVSLASGQTNGTQLTRVLMTKNPIQNTVTIRVSKDSEGVTYYQDYVVQVERELTLAGLSASCGGAALSLTAESGESGFVSERKSYYVTVPAAARQLELTARWYTSNVCYGEETSGYSVSVDGVQLDSADGSGTAVVPLDGTANSQQVTILVQSEKAPNGASVYTLQVRKAPPVAAYIEVGPEKALLRLYETQSGELVNPEQSGEFYLAEGYRYSYTLTLYGYVGRSGVLEPTRGESGSLILKDGDAVYPVEVHADTAAVHLNWTLDPVPANGAIQPGIPSEWPDFRGNINNNAVVSVATPVEAEKGTLYWANKLGEGYATGAVGNPILVDGDLITYAGSMIFRVDTLTGEVKARANMDHSSSFAINSPTYSDGMVFVGLANGTVQAFNADTLESLWIYKDPLGGQPNCPLAVRDGYLYTGFWNGEKTEANFVCLSITDEDPSRSNEAKCASWHYTQQGGFYWAGPCVQDDFLLVGTDDGENGYSSNTGRLLLLDSRTGELLDSLDDLTGDVRSSVVYDAETDAYYFTSKGGKFYSVRVSGDGTLTDVWSVALENGAGGVSMSTCSPAVYGGRAYIGVSGSSQFGAYSGHNITVIDLYSQSIAYRVPTKGYPQTSGLLTTAYEPESGCVYVYFFDNFTPGILCLLRDHPGQTAPDYVTVENGMEAAYAIFTPVGAQAEYALCSPIVDSYGTIYFKNDSANLMAFGSVIEELVVTEQPEKTDYAQGEPFEPAGMQIVAVYANGLTRDVTDYVTYKTDGLTEDDAEFTVSLAYGMYHNQESGGEMLSGVETEEATVIIQLHIGSGVSLGDVNGDGKVDNADAQLILDQEAGLLEEPLPADRADVNGDGVVDSNDAVLVARYAAGSISSFPAERTENQAAPSGGAEAEESAYEEE